MLSDDISVYRMFRNIKNSPEGQEFLDFLTEIQEANYKSFLQSPPGEELVHKGYGLAVDKLLNILARCDQNEETSQSETWG